MRRLSLIVLTYSLWLASAAFALGIMLWIRILVLIDLPMLVLRVNPWALGAIDKFGTVTLGLMWLIFVIASEWYFRRLLKQELSVIGVAKVFLAEVVFLGAVYGGHLLI